MHHDNPPTDVLKALAVLVIVPSLIGMVAGLQIIASIFGGH
jgi:hypothetical protein